MKKVILNLTALFVLIFLIQNVFGQENLIPNPGFEEYKKMPDGDGKFNGYIKDWSNINNKEGFPNATPDFLHKKGTGNGRVSTYYYSKVEPFEGDAMMGVIVMPKTNGGFYEYVLSPLKQNLVAGKRYEISFYIINGEPKYCNCSGRGLGFYLSENLPLQNQAERLNVTPQWMIEDNLHTTKWEKIEIRFTPDKNFKYLTLGYFPETDKLNYKPVNGSSGDCIYFFVDQFKLIEVPSDGSSAMLCRRLPEGVTRLTSTMGNVVIGEEAPPEKFTHTVKINVKDNKTGNAIAASLSIVNLATKTEVAKFQFTDDQKEFTFVVPDPSIRYGIFTKVKGYLDGSENIESIVPDKNSISYKTIFMSPLLKGESIVLKNIYFETAKSTLQNDAFVELEKLYQLMKDNEKLIIEISGHTDSDGDDTKNLELSQKRALAVVQYLKDKGISTDRLKSIGQGETKPVSSNTTPDGKKRNRRVELKILDN